MALNYLQRIAVAASRTSAPVRPPVSGPPPMPSAGDGTLTPFGSTIQPDYAMPSATGDESVAGRASQLRGTESVSRLSSVKASYERPASIRAGANAVESASASEDASEASSSRDQQASEATTSDDAAEKSQAITRALLRPTEGTILRVPKGLRPTPKPMPVEKDVAATFANHRSATEKACEPMRSAPGVEATPTPAASDEVSQTTTAHVEQSGPTAPTADAYRSSGQLRLPEIRRRATRGPDDDRTAHPLPAAFTPKSSPRPAMPPSPSTGVDRENRITIGRVEVQVNNRLPATPAAPRPAPTADTQFARALEARYLGRFFIRP